MNKGSYIIVSNECVAERTFRMVLDGDCSQLARPGQFVDLALEGRFLRRPFSVMEWGDGRLTILYKIVGEGTLQMSSLGAGECLDLLTGLGNGFDASACRHSALLVGGGLGAAPLYMLAKQLLAEGKKVQVVLGFNKASEIVLEEQYRALGVPVAITTVDGSAGSRGFVTAALPSDGFDYFYTCGPVPMMKAVCSAIGTGGEASLEERMGCGCGICYGCTCRTSGGPKRICKDGPVFKKEDIIW